MIDVGQGSDWVDGGAGQDRLSVDLSDDAYPMRYGFGDGSGNGNFVGRYYASASFEQLHSALAGVDEFLIEYSVGLPSWSVQYRNVEAVNLTTGAGNDLLIYQGGTHYDGGADYDTLYADFSATTQALNWNADAGSFTPVNGVTVANIERFLVSSGSGDDLFRATQSGMSHHVDTGAGNDTVEFGAGDDYVASGAGNDSINAGAGTDTVDGGAGIDTADYSNASGSVTVSLTTNTSSGADGADTLISIENVRGSATFGDTLIGNVGDNLLDGLGGDDVLDGGAGNDTLLGGAGNDLIGYGGTATISGGSGTDTVALSVTAVEAGNAPVTITDFQAGAGGDRLDLADTITRLQALGMSGSDPFAAGWMQLRTVGGDTLVEMDLTGSTNGAQWQTLATLQGVAASAVLNLNFVQAVNPVAVVPNSAPTLAAPIADQLATEDSSFNFTIPTGSFADADPSDTLTYSAALADGGALPAWLTFNAATQTFNGIPTNGDVGVLQLQVYATDNSGASVSDAFALTVANTNDAPVGTATAVLPTGTEDTPYLVSAATLLTGFSDVDGDALSVANMTADHGTLADIGNGTWTFTPATNYNGPVSLGYNVVDGNGGSVASTQSFSLAAVNDAPVNAAPIGQTITEDDALQFRFPSGNG